MNDRDAAMPLKIRHQESLQRIGLAVLGCVAITGFIAAAAVMPGLGAFFKCFPRKSSWQCDQHMTRAVRRLLRRGLIERFRRGRVVGYQLTDRGRAYLVRYQLADAEFVPPKRWDGKWRLIVFDVPERWRYLRDRLRDYLQQLGFYPIQKSVWLFPYPCQDVVGLLKVDLGLDRSVQYFTVGSFEDREEEKLWRFRFDV